MFACSAAVGHRVVLPRLKRSAGASSRFFDVGKAVDVIFQESGMLCGRFLVFRIIAASVSGQRERKIVGVSVNKVPSVADVARPSALRTAVVRRAVRHRSIASRAVVVASSARRDGKTSAG